MKNEVLVKYYAIFDEMPPFIYMLPYASEEYQLLMMNAILSNKKLTEDDFKNVEYDVSYNNSYFDLDRESDIDNGGDDNE